MADTDWKVISGTSGVTLNTAGTYLDSNIIVAPHDAFVKSGSNAAAGLVPAPDTTEGNSKYLCEDGTWKNLQTLTIGNQTYDGSEAVEIESVSAETLELADVATSGNIADLDQTVGDYLIFNCGDSTTVV